MDYFIFKDIDSRNIPGLVVNSLPPITKAAKRIERIEIDGKDGDITEERGYKSYDKPITITLLQDCDVNVLINWLNGSGRLVLSNEDDKYYEAEIVDQIDFERLFKYLPVKIIFHVQPYKYLLNENVSTIEKVLSEEAEELELTDCAGGEGSLSINGGNTEQKQYKGNQLVDFNTLSKTSDTTVSFENDILTLTSTGVTKYAQKDITDLFKSNPGKTLKFVYDNIDVTSQYGQNLVYLSITEGGTTSTQVLLNHSLDNTPYTIQNDTSNISTVRLRITTNGYSSTSYDASLIIDKPMLQFGTEEKEYEPYVGGIASPNSDFPQDVVSVGSNVNLFDGEMEQGSINGSTGENASSSTIVRSKNYIEIPDGVDTLRFIRTKVGTSAYAIGLRFYDSSKGYLSAATYNVNSKIININMIANAKYFRFVDLSNDLTNKYKITTDLNNTEYTKYGCGSVDFKVVNKNLWGGFNQDYSRAGSGVDFKTYTNGIITANGTATAITQSVAITNAISNGLYVTLKAGTYTVSCAEATSNKNIQILDESGAIINSVGATPKTITLTKKQKIILRLALANGTTCNNETFHIQLEKGNIVTSYVEHKESIVSIPLPQGMTLSKILDTNYYDYIHTMQNKWYKHKEITKRIFTGNESFSQATNQSYSYNMYFTSVLDYRRISGKTIMSNYYKGVENLSGTSPIFAKGNNVCCFRNNSSDTQRSVYFTNKIDTAQNFRALLAEQYANGNPLAIWYVLIEPEEEEITDEDTIAALNQLKHLLLYEGYTLITCENDVKPTIQIEYASTDNALIVNHGLEKAKPILKIYGDGHGSIYVNGKEIFTIDVDDEYVIVDSKEEEAYKGDILKNRFMNGDFPILDPGENVISWGGNIEKVEVMPNSRWL